MPKMFVFDEYDSEQLYNFLLSCGLAGSPEELSVRLIDGIGQFIPYDTASVYLLDGSGKICGQHLRGIDERWSKIYLAYYIHTDNQQYNLFQKKSFQNPSGKLVLNVYNWEQIHSSEFIPDFIRARGLLHTCGFGLYDLNNRLRITVALDRMHPSPFKNKEILFLKTFVPLVSNLHKNFYYQNYTSIPAATKEENNLTARESQIAELLCQSLSPAQISQTLHIAQSTTYKHIANIYEKMHVSSQRQLLSKLLIPQK